MALSDKIVELKLQLHSVIKQHFNLERKVNSLRTREHVLTEEIANLKVENDYSHSQITELSSEISQLRCQKAIINVCTESEKAKIEVYLSYLEKHKNGFNVLFNNERAITVVQREQLKQKEVEEKEKERQKMEKILEKNIQQAKDTVAIEDESVAIEKECISLSKRNKAIMKKLRRKLIETEDMRRELTKKNKICNN